MSVQSQIDRINAIKERIRTNLVAQGVTVPDDTTLDEMATQILSVAGEDGVSATHSWNGTTLTITSASGTSSANLKGDSVKGDKGDTGATGVSVSSVKQTTTSSSDGGSNVVTVTLSNGTTSTFTVKNGSKGSSGTNGTNGKDGKTPVKGTDYWTPADQEAIVQQVITALGTPVFGRVDADNNIILTGELAEGIYTLKYENADGNVVEVGTISNIETSGEIPLTFTLGKIDNSNGNISSSENYIYSDLISIESGKEYTLECTNVCATFKVCYYNASGAFMSTTSDNILQCGDSGVIGSGSTVIPMVSGAASFRIRVYCCWYDGGYAPSVELAKVGTKLTWALS